MPGVHPSVQAYLDRLPEGLASYPECRAKASLLRDMLASRPLDPTADDLPQGLRALVAAPPPVSSWISEVEFCTASLAIYARHFGGTDMAAYQQWIFTFNTLLFRKPLYRVLFALVSPQRLLVGTEKRWGTFHRGTSLSVVDRGPTSARVRVEYPPHLYGIELLHAFAAALRSAVVVAGARRAFAEVEACGPTHGDLWIRWEE